MHILASDDATEQSQNTVPPQLFVFIVCLAFAYGGMSVVDSMGVTMCYALLGKRFASSNERHVIGCVFVS